MGQLASDHCTNNQSPQQTATRIAALRLTLAGLKGFFSILNFDFKARSTIVVNPLNLMLSFKVNRWLLLFVTSSDTQTGRLGFLSRTGGDALRAQRVVFDFKDFDSKVRSIQSPTVLT
jgi:hypothetical protein